MTYDERLEALLARLTVQPDIPHDVSEIAADLLVEKIATERTTKLLAIFDAYSETNAVEIASGDCPWCQMPAPHAHALGTLLITFPEGKVPTRAETLDVVEEVHVWS